MITVHLYGKLRRFAEESDPACNSIVSIPAVPGETIEGTLKTIGIPEEELGSNIFLNGEYSGLTREVKPSDRLGVFPDDMQLLYKWYFTKQEGDRSDDPG